MKKAISIMLVLVICLSMCACGSIEQENAYADVKGKLVGVWEGRTDASFVSQEADSEMFYTTVWFTFENDGSASVQARLNRKQGGTVDTKLYYGTYTIINGTITLNYTSVAQFVNGTVKNKTSYSGSDTLQYKLQNGMLSVNFDGTELEKE